MQPASTAYSTSGPRSPVVVAGSPSPDPSSAAPGRSSAHHIPCASDNRSAQRPRSADTLRQSIPPVPARSQLHAACVRNSLTFRPVLPAISARTFTSTTRRPSGTADSIQAAAIHFGASIAAGQESPQTQPFRGAYRHHSRCRSAYMNGRQVSGSKKEDVNGRDWVGAAAICRSVSDPVSAVQLDPHFPKTGLSLILLQRKPG